MTTDHPAAVSTSATALPPGPEPTTMASLMGLTAGSLRRRCSPAAARRPRTRSPASP
ncbi:MAG: PEP-CTERM sorting domain-containing protein [Actinobacteria bacterium]|nr:MAG: PEP-CTERM sorting domain-containing protein [Actinomycetota bacterium]